ncbi:hypothetical protein EYC98_12145 [Halieaceae bacterium IMCC14734]|uniref:Uncharacterized protein n=1 Tax=Candidatus Litorirhabdus singularis TaxID=2518993 RepID=A0ABT3TJM3_9GAMM|nr:hypothetical protein [Candidatus Litorirhabdus singularis]MCX2981614.1 hypothetical protein [Candidatus Litorirhabdus singularis]
MTNVAPQKILVASLTSLVFAGLILVAVVLPAEYGWDPLGSGRWLGLMGFAQTDVNPLQSQSLEWLEDSISFELQPFASVEYKYRLEQGATLLYRWQATGEVVADMHSQPDGASEGYAESFARFRARSDQGGFTAPFTGIHGWFWQNRGATPVTIELQVNGFFDYALEMNAGHSFRYEFEAD